MLNERIRDLRCAMKLNQTELAEKLNVSKQTVSNWENNNILPSIDTLIKVADFFGVSIDYLLGMENKRNDILDTSALTDEEIQDLQKVINHIRKNR